MCVYSAQQLAALGIHVFYMRQTKVFSKGEEVFDGEVNKLEIKMNRKTRVLNRSMTKFIISLYCVHLIMCSELLCVDFSVTVLHICYGICLGPKTPAPILNS